MSHWSSCTLRIYKSAKIHISNRKAEHNFGSHWLHRLWVCVCVCFLIFIFCGQRRPRFRQPVGAEGVARFFFRTSVKESKQINNDVKEPESFEEPDEAAKPVIFLQTTPAVGNLIYFGSSKYWSWLLKRGTRKEELRLHKVEKCTPETWYFYLTPFKALVWLPRQRHGWCIFSTALPNVPRTEHDWNLKRIWFRSWSGSWSLLPPRFSRCCSTVLCWHIWTQLHIWIVIHFVPLLAAGTQPTQLPE